MALQFIIGRAGSGKSRIMYENMIKESELKQKKNYIAVVPEQYSMETQKEILALHPNKGSFNIEVTSLTRLAYTVFEEQGVSGYKVMDDLGKTLVMRKVLEDCKKELVIYKDKTSMPGFAEKMKMVVSEFKQYGIDTIKLHEMKKDVEQKPILKYKLNDIEVIYNTFNKYIDEKVITAEDVLNIFCKYIPQSQFVKNTHFYFDGFTGFTPSQYKVLELLMMYADGVDMAVTLPDDEEKFKGFSRFELFSLSKETIEKTRTLAERHGIEIKKTIVAGKDKKPYRIRNNEELCFIEDNIFRNKAIKKYQEDCNSIEIKAASNPHSEAEYVASKISYLVVNKGYRYKDIAVITGDMEGYYRYLEEEFSKYNIPAFIDHKRDISSNPFVDGIKAAIEVIEKDFSYESVFHMVRLGFADIEMEEADILENYVLQGGKRGFNSYAREWKKLYKGMSDEELIVVNDTREKILNLIKPLRERLKKNQATVEEMTSAVYEFMVSQQMQEKIEEFGIRFKANAMDNGNGRISSHYQSLAKEYEQAYETIINMLDKFVSLMGDEIMSIKEYKQVLQAGFESIKVGIIPPGLDTVMVGDIQRTRLKDTKKILFFIGVNDGIIPSAGVSGGIITDSDRDFLGDKNYILAPTARDNVFKQRLYLYSLLAKPTEKVCLTYSNSNADGSVRRKSYLINTLQSLFSKLIIQNTDDNKELNHITSKKAAYNYVADNIFEYRQNKDNNDDFMQLCSVLMEDSNDEKIVNKMMEGAFYKSEKPTLDSEIAKKLYGNKDNIGITRLEKYASCAYSQFLKNGLKLGKRARYELAAFDIGNLYHDAINEYFATVWERGIQWNDLEIDISHEIIDDCVEKVMESYDNEALSSTARNLFIKSQVRETAQKTVDVLTKHINSGKFVPAEYELRVEHGRIDRVDIWETDEKIYVKVIDYKSGNKRFDISETMMGLQMQLMVYLKDAMDYEKRKNPNKDVIPAAGLYFHIHDPYVDRPNYEKVIKEFRTANPDSELKEEEIILKEIEKIKYEQYKMSGLVNDKEDVVRLMDEVVFEKRKSSQILPVTLTKGGMSKQSNVMNEETYINLVEYVAEKAEEMQEEIVKGEIDINPVENACDNCPYGSVCRFDEKLGDKYRQINKVTLDEVKEMLGNGENHEVDR